VSAGLGVSYATATTSGMGTVPLGVGLSLGKDQNFDLALEYLLHPAVGQVDGAFALSLAFALP
jgi:hypothetical protein